MRRTGLVIVALAALLALLAFWFGMPAATVQPPQPTAGATAPASSAKSPRITLVKPPASGAVKRLPTRVVVQSAPAQGRGGVSDAEAPGAAAGEGSTQGEGPVDRRLPDQQDGGGLQATVREMMDFASEGIERCVIELATVRPESVGEVEIGFQFDADGLSEAWVDEASDLPQSTRDCLAGAVYAVDWSALTDDPVQVTWRFDYSTQEP